MNKITWDHSHFKLNYDHLIVIILPRFNPLSFLGEVQFMMRSGATPAGSFGTSRGGFFFFFHLFFHFIFFEHEWKIIVITWNHLGNHSMIMIMMIENKKERSITNINKTTTKNHLGQTEIKKWNKIRIFTLKKSWESPINANQWSACTLCNFTRRGTAKKEKSRGVLFFPNSIFHLVQKTCSLLPLTPVRPDRQPRLPRDKQKRFWNLP